MKIKKRVGGGEIGPDDVVCFQGHTGHYIDVEGEGTAVAARWSDAGLWQTFTIENHGGRVIYSGDAVFLKAHTGAIVHVEGTSVFATWREHGEWQKLIVHKKSGDGPIMPGDAIFLRA